MKTLFRHRAHNHRQGFSLAELMVVILILGLLVTIVGRNVMGNLATSNQQVARVDINVLAKAIEDYRINNQRFPESLEELIEEDVNGHRFLRQTSVPKDPWRNEYFYEPPSSGSDPIIISYGRDGEPGGEGEDQDITYEDILEGR